MKWALLASTIMYSLLIWIKQAITPLFGEMALLVRLSVRPVSHDPAVTSRFWLARHRPRPLPPPAAGLCPSSVRARHLYLALALPTAHVSHAPGQIRNPSTIYRLFSCITSVNSQVSRMAKAEKHQTAAFINKKRSTPCKLWKITTTDNVCLLWLLWHSGISLTATCTWWRSTPYMSSHFTRSRYWYSARTGTWPLKNYHMLTSHQCSLLVLIYGDLVSKFIRQYIQYITIVINNSNIYWYTRTQHNQNNETVTLKSRNKIV